MKYTIPLFPVLHDYEYMFKITFSTRAYFDVTSGNNLDREKSYFASPPSGNRNWSKKSPDWNIIIQAIQNEKGIQPVNRSVIPHFIYSIKHKSINLYSFAQMV